MEIYKLRSLLALAVLSILISCAQTQTADADLPKHCDYQIIEGKSPVISATADSNWHTYRPEVEVDSGEDDTDLCQKRCCQDSDCELVAITRNEVSNNTECVLFKCVEGGCSLTDNYRYTVHLKSKRVSQSTSTSARPYQIGNDITVTEKIIGHLTATTPEQPELKDEVTTLASEPTTTKIETDIAIKTGYIPPKTGNPTTGTGNPPTETGNIPTETENPPTETDNIPPETSILPSETGNIYPEKENRPDKTLPPITDKISSEDHETGSESPHLTAVPPISILDKTLAPEPDVDDEEKTKLTTLMPPPSHIDGIITTTHSPIESSHITTLSVTHLPNEDTENSSNSITTVTKNLPTTENIITAKQANQSIRLISNMQNTNSTDSPTTYNNDTVAETKPYIWQVPWWYDGTVNQQHVTLFAMLLIGVSMALIVAFCITRICVRSWRVKRRTRKGYLYLSRFM